MHYLIMMAAVLLAVVLSASASSKLRSRAAFAAFTASLGRLAPRARGRERPVAVAVVAGEVAAAPLILVAPAAGFVLAAVLLASFGVAIATALRAGRTAPCRCFGASSTELGPAQLARAVLLAAAAGIGAAAALSGGPAAGSLITLMGEAHPGGLCVAATAGSVLAVLAIFLDDIVPLFTTPERI